MSAHVFKLLSNEDGSLTLWFSHHGRLMKVARYDQGIVESLNDAESFETVQHRDATIFFRGWDAAKRRT